MQRPPDARQKAEIPANAVSISEAARQIGVNKSTLSRQVDSGAVRSYGGKVVIAEVIADRAANLNSSQARRKTKGQAAAQSAPSGTARAGATTAPADATKPASDATGGGDTDALERAIASGQLVSLADASRIKENYLARQRALDFEVASGQLVDRGAATKVFFEKARQFRDAWMNWPARVSTLLASDLGVEERKLVEVLTKYVRQHLTELGEPAAPEFPKPDDRSR